jgi:hypothetical protein
VHGDTAQHCYNDAKKHQVDARHTGISSHLVSSFKHRLRTSSERIYKALLPVVSLTLLREMRMHRSQRLPTPKCLNTVTVSQAATCDSPNGGCVRSRQLLQALYPQ